MVAYNKEFGCCLEYALKPINSFNNHIEIYNATIHCNVYLNVSIKGVLRYLKEVIEFSHMIVNLTREACEVNLTREACEDICNERTEGWYNGYVVFWVIALIIGLVGNILVLMTFLQSAELRKNVANYFVTSLAASDLLVMFFIVPLKIHSALNNKKFCASIIVCRLFYTTDVTFFAASITNIFAITIDRFFAVTRPYNYKEIVTAGRARFVIILIWIYATVWGVMVNYNARNESFGCH